MEGSEGEKGSRGSPAWKFLAVAVVAVLVGAYAGMIFFGEGNITGELTGGPEEPVTVRNGQQSNGVSMVVIAGDDAAKGSEDAPVTIVEFSDYQCPFCGRFYEQTLPLIEEEYVSTGKVRMVYRDFPLGFHEEAQGAAEAAECADEQGMYWEFHDVLFENQDLLSESSYREWAGELGMDSQAFGECLDLGRQSAEVREDFSDGSAAGVSGTPTFFIGPTGGTGKKVVGAQPFSTFEKAIEELL